MTLTSHYNSAIIFREHGNEIMRTFTAIKNSTEQERFKSLFGITPAVCSLIWHRIFARIPRGGRELHLLWALLFLKVYATEPVNRIIAGVDEKTFRKWSWAFIELMADMEVIRWEDRYSRQNQRCMVSVDGSDFRICEPYRFDTKWYSNKFHGPGLRYELGLCISTGHIVWVNGPYLCGSYSDLKIFQLRMKRALDCDEVVIADGGYPDERCMNVGKNATETKFYSVVRARHETVNRRMKQFNVLSYRFRHALKLHSSCFHAVANISQLMIRTCEPLFKIKLPMI